MSAVSTRSKQSRAEAAQGLGKQACTRELQGASLAESPLHGDDILHDRLRLNGILQSARTAGDLVHKTRVCRQADAWQKRVTELGWQGPYPRTAIYSAPADDGRVQLAKKR